MPAHSTTLKSHSHEEMSEVTMALLELFDSTDAAALAPFIPTIQEIMQLPAEHRVSVGISLMWAFFQEHALDISCGYVRREAVDLQPLWCWSICDASAALENQRKLEYAQSLVAAA